MKVLILDSGTLINLSMNGLLYLLEKLKKGFDGKFVITEQVKYEIIDKPSHIPKYELGALMIKDLLNRGIIELPSSLGINSEEIKARTSELMDMANHYLTSKHGWINIVSEGEMSCLALSDELRKKSVENIIAIDERTTRILAEKPENLGLIMSEKLKQRIDLVAKDLNIFRKYRFIRSSEIVFIAYKKGLVSIQGKDLLEALLYATKYHGCSISYEEINQMKKL